MTTKMQAVSTEEAPSPFPQFSQAIKYNGLVFCSGNVGLIPGTDLQLVEGTVKDRAVGIFASATRARSWMNKTLLTDCKDANLEES